MRRWRVGVRSTWYTRALFEWRDAAADVGRHVWLCHKCGYWPDSYSALPARSCYNCKEPWETTADDPQGKPIKVVSTDYGYARE